MIGREIITEDFQNKNKANKLKVISMFKYKNQKEEYIVYLLNNGIGYSKAFIKNDCIVCLEPKIEKRKIVEELINKILNDEELNNYHTEDLSFINKIELIGKDSFELSKTNLSKIDNKFFPKKEKINTPKKESSYSAIFFIFFLIIVCIMIGFQFLTIKKDENQIVTCNKEENEKTINAMLEETIVLSFHNHSLNEIETTKIYRFQTDSAYQNFKEEGLMWQYMTDNEEGGYKLDDNKNIFMIITKEEINEKYKEETNDKKLINIYQKEKGYQCKIETVGE